mmetsp:Transcript_5270/g.6891  ORF Transcript_5270/g.6891 Transcript_5270/m.6891 type:complete len:602 (+) Transcript_5270:279-2084(+)
MAVTTRRRPTWGSSSWLFATLLLASSFVVVVVRAEDSYFNDGYNNYQYNKYNNNNNDDNAVNDDQYNAAQAENGDDAYQENQYEEDQYDKYNDAQNQDGNDDANNYVNEYDDGQNDVDDDVFHFNSNVDFGSLSVMPVSCINYNNGHMIKFQLFDTANSYQCHFADISTFVVSIAHYMKAYFNYQALVEGQDFSLPADASFLNCNKLQMDDSDSDSDSDNNNANGNDELQLYAKIGCMERATFTSTKLQLHFYVDAQCSQPFEDGRSARQHANKGYLVTDLLEMSTDVSFRVPFYSCHTCAPEQVSGTFNKRNNNWYDDDYISANGQKQQQYNDNANDGDGDDDGNGNYYQAANDDVNYDDAKFDDDQYNDYNDNYNGGNRGLRLQMPRQLQQRIISMRDYLEAYFEEKNSNSNNEESGLTLWSSSSSNSNKKPRETRKARALYDNYYDIGEWNMCDRIYKYGIWCDADCQALDFFRTDQWSSSDIFLLSIMCTFLSGMMLLIVAKRLKAQQKARMYGDDQPLPGLPPFGMAIIFILIMVMIVGLAKMKFVNETLVFAVVTCILLFIYMLKLTLFENRRPVLLAAPRHDMFDNPLNDHLFD